MINAVFNIPKCMLHAFFFFFFFFLWAQSLFFYLIFCFVFFMLISWFLVGLNLDEILAHAMSVCFSQYFNMLPFLALSRWCFSNKFVFWLWRRETEQCSRVSNCSVATFVENDKSWHMLWHVVAYVVTCRGRWLQSHFWHHYSGSSIWHRSL